MKIIHKDLCRLYQAYVDEKVPLSRKDCPSTKKIINFFRPKSSNKNKTKIIEHMTQCACCVQEFDSILNILRSSKNLAEDINHMLLSEKNNSSGQKELNQGRFILGLSWKYAFLILGAVLTIFSLLTLFNNNPSLNSRKSENRNRGFPQVHLIQPKNEKHSKTNLVFQWDRLSGAETYLLEIYDETLAPIWKSPKLLKNSCSLPHEIIQKLIKHKNYFWMVTAFLQDGKRIESDLEIFSLAD